MAELRQYDGTQFIAVTDEQHRNDPLDPHTQYLLEVEADALYVNVAGDTMTGELNLPDQVSVQPSNDPTVAAARGYVDQVITVSPVKPDPVVNIPVRGSLVWYVVEDAVLPVPAAPTGFAGVYDTAEKNVLMWVDSTDATAVYEIRYSLTGPVGDADILLVSGVASGVGLHLHVKDAAAQGATTIYYAIKAIGSTGSSGWIQAIVDALVATTTTLAVDTTTVPPGGTITLTADSTGTTGTVQFMRDGAPFGAPVPVDANGVATTTDTIADAGTHIYTAEFIRDSIWEGSASNSVTVTVALTPTTTTLASSAATPTVGSTITLTADTTATTGAVQFTKNGVALGAPAPVDANGVATLTDTVGAEPTATYGAIYHATGPWQGSTASPVTVASIPQAPTNLRALNLGQHPTSIDMAWDAAPGATLYHIYVGWTGQPLTYHATTSGTSYHVATMGPDVSHFWQVEAANGADVRSAGLSNQLNVRSGHHEQSIAAGSGTVSGAVSSHNRWRQNQWGYGGIKDPYWGWYENKSYRYYGFLGLPPTTLLTALNAKYPFLNGRHMSVSCHYASIAVQRKQNVGMWGGDFDINPFWMSLGNGVSYSNPAEPAKMGNVANVPINGWRTPRMHYSLPAIWYQAIYQYHAQYNGILISPYHPNGARQEYGAWVQNAQWSMNINWPKFVTVAQVNTSSW